MARKGININRKKPKARNVRTPKSSFILRSTISSSRRIRKNLQLRSAKRISSRALNGIGNRILYLRRLPLLQHPTNTRRNLKRIRSRTKRNRANIQIHNQKNRPKSNTIFPKRLHIKILLNTPPLTPSPKRSPQNPTKSRNLRTHIRARTSRNRSSRTLCRRTNQRRKENPTRSRRRRWNNRSNNPKPIQRTPRPPRPQRQTQNKRKRKKENEKSRIILKHYRRAAKGRLCI